MTDGYFTVNKHGGDILTIQQVKQWLNRARNIEKEIDILKQEKVEAFEGTTKITSAAEGERVQISVSNSSENKFIEYSEYSVLIDNRIDELYAVKCEILNAINTVEDGTLRILLELRYLQGETWERIAQSMHYSYKHIVHSLHPKALKKLKEVIECYIAPVI